MPTIELSQASFDRLKELAEPLVDTAETVIGRLITAYQAASQFSGSGRKALKNGAGSAKAIQRDRKRARKGERTPTEEFYQPLLQALSQAGGQLPANDAIDHVGMLMSDRLNPVDLGRLPSGEIRWRNTVRWTQRHLKEEGKLDKNAPYGYWKLSAFNPADSSP